MSLSKPVTLARLNDLILGSFVFVPPSETLDHLVRYLSTWSGSDKLFMVVQYAVKLLIPLLNLRARLQHRAGLRKAPTSSAAAGLARLSSLLGDSRTLWRIWGLLPIVQWLISLERSQQATRTLLTVERLQGWSMLAYYPLEHLYYLCSHGIIPSTIPNPLAFLSSKATAIKLDPNAMSVWSCRFWALYVALQFVHLAEDRKLLLKAQRTLKKAKGTGSNQAEKEELQRRWDAYWSEVLVNIGYLPLTVHWSLEKGLFKNDVWVGVFGLIAGLASFRSGWRATALPSPPAPPEVSETPKAEETVVGYDAGN